MNIGLIGDFLYPILTKEIQQPFNGSKVGGTEFINALIRYGNSKLYFFTLPYQEQFIKTALENKKKSDDLFKKVNVYSYSELNNKIAELSILHDPMFHRVTALNNFRSVYLERNLPITNITLSMSHQLILNTCFSIMIGNCIKDFDSLICISKQAQVNLENLFSSVKTEIKTLTGLDKKIPSNTPYIPLGIFTDEFKPRNKIDLRTKFNFPIDKKILLYVGRLSPYDKSDLFPILSAYKKYISKLQDKPLFLIIGDNKEFDYAQMLNKFVEHLEIQEFVNIIENVPSGEISNYYSLADIFISPSDTLTETMGLSILEAMSSALPIIASDWSGYKELVEHGKNGFKVSTYWQEMDNDFLNITAEIYDPLTQFYLGQSTAIDTDELFYYLDLLINNDELREEFSKNSRKLALEKYSWEVIIKQYENLWFELIEKAKFSQDRPNKFLYQDFFKTFNSYPTKVLNYSDELEASESGKLILFKNFDTYYIEQKNFIKKLVIYELCKIANKKISIGQIIEKLKYLNISEQKINHHIIWALKYGLLKKV